MTVYKNQTDTIRINLFKVDHEDGRKPEWNADIWRKLPDGGASVETYSQIAGDLFPTRREGKEFFEDTYGMLTPIGRTETVTEGW